MTVPNRSERSARWTTRAFGVVLAAALLAGVAYVARYRGALRAAVVDLVHLTWDENVTKARFSAYAWGVLASLRYDAETGTYSLRDALREAEADGNPYEAALLHWHQGDFRRAIELLERDIEERGRNERNIFWLAMSHFRQAEVENCLAPLGHHAGSGGNVEAAAERTTPQRAGLASRRRQTDAVAAGGRASVLCSLPLRRLRYADKSGYEKAAVLFHELLEEYDPESVVYRWMLNYLHMVTGTYPDGVPAPYRIDSRFTQLFYGDGRERVARRYADLSFRERAHELKVDTLDAGKGVAVEDFDRDGFLDIVTAGNFDRIRYYRNQGGRSFVERTDHAGLAGITQPHIISAVDYDNDGWIDLFIGRPFFHFRLYRNTGGGVFEDVTYASGLLEPNEVDENLYMTWVAAWADVDADGDLDVFLCQYGERVPVGVFDKPAAESRLYLNEGRRFRDATRAFGIRGLVAQQNFIAAAFGDYDGDGFPDLFLSSTNAAASVLLRNDHGGRFAIVELGADWAPGFTVAFLDIDHDGKLDLFRGGTSFAKQAIEMTVFGRNLHKYRKGFSTVFEQTSEGFFKERRDFFRDAMPMATMGASFGDINNDGCYDFYLGTGGPEGWFVLPNVFFVGVRDGTRCGWAAENISMLHGFGTTQKGHGIVFFDFDNDGDQDVYSSLGGMWPADRFPNQFFVNESRLSSSWVKIRLRGRRTNYFGVGARIKVVAENKESEEIIRYYHMTNGTGFGSTPYVAHIGLQDAVRIRYAEVEWPNSARRSYHVRIGRVNVLDEEK